MVVSFPNARLRLEALGAPLYHQLYNVLEAGARSNQDLETRGWPSWLVRSVKWLYRVTTPGGSRAVFLKDFCEAVSTPFDPAVALTTYQRLQLEETLLPLAEGELRSYLEWVLTQSEPMMRLANASHDVNTDQTTLLFAARQLLRGDLIFYHRQLSGALPASWNNTYRRHLIEAIRRAHATPTTSNAPSSSESGGST